MTKPAHEQPANRKPFITLYGVMWSVMGSLGVAYLGVALLAPAWLAELTPSVAERQRDDLQPQIMKLSADVSGLRASLTRMQLDFDSTKSDAVAQATATKALDDRLTEMEKSRANPLPPVAEASPNATAPAAMSTAMAPKVPAVARETMASAETKPATTPSSKVASPDGLSSTPMPPIVTGSIDGKPDTPPAAKTAPDVAMNLGPAVVKPASKPVGIQIGSDVSLDGLRARWTVLSSSHADQLNKLGPRYALGGDDTNPVFNLLAGPIKSRAEAKKICKDLEAHDVICKVAEFKGEAF